MIRRVERKMFTLNLAVGTAVMIVSVLLSAVSLKGEISFLPGQDLRVQGKIVDTRAVDLSGNGLSDIIVLSGLEGEGRSNWTVSIFRQSEEGKLPVRPDHVFTLDSLVTLISTGSLPGSGMGVLLSIVPGGVHSLYPGKEDATDSFDRLIEIDTPIMTHVNEGPVFIDSMRDWNGDGKSELLVFDFNGFSLLSFDEDDRLVFKTHVNYQPRLYAYKESEDTSPGDRLRLRLRYDFPIVQPGEYDGDGKVDLFITSGERLSVSIQKDLFDYADPVLIKDFSRSPREADENNWRPQIDLVDFTGDGIMDFSETRWKGTGLTETEAEIRLYEGGGTNGISPEPDQVLLIKDALPNMVIIEDLDGDEKEELIVPTMKFGIISFVRMLTSGNLHIKALVFDDDPSGVFEEEPRFVHSLSAKFDFSGTSNIVSGLDDFDGDGYIDFAFGTRKNEISIFRGTGGRGNRIFSRDPVLVLSEDSNGFLKTDDLDGNGRKDFLLYYPEEGLIRIYFSEDQAK